jgi:uncharacterized protein YbcI
MSSDPSSTSSSEPVTKTVARALVSAVKKYYGKGPVSARAHFVEEDILVVVMRDPATTAESAMVRAGREEDARRFRLAFQDEYAGELRGIVEVATGRRVATYHSQIMFNPDLLFEIFVFEPEEPRAAGTDG